MMTNGFVTAALVVVCLLTPVAAAQSLDALELPPAPAQPWRFKQFPILGWWGPPGTARVEDFRAYKDAGFTIHATNADAAYAQAMEHVRAAGLKAMPFRQKQGFAMPGASATAPAGPGGAAYDDLIVGWITNDEPSGDAAVAESIRAVNALMREGPDRRTLFNMLPPHAQHNPDTTAVIRAAVRNGLPVLSFDHYYIFEDGTDHEAVQCAHLDLFRKASLEHKRPFWAFALTEKHFGYRRPSESDLRWMVYTNLAYGAKGLWYFTYWGPTDWEGWHPVAIVDPKTGATTDLYEHVKAVNHAVLAMGDVLLGLTNEDVFHTRPPEGQRALPDGKWWISKVKAQDAIVSFFRGAGGARYALVVNKRHGKDKPAAELTDDVALTFAPDVAGVEVVNWLEGNAGPLTLRDSGATLRVAGGTGVLLRASTR